MILRKYYPTIVLSDIHLGSEHSRTEEVTRFLKHVDCDRLILNGDIIDGWQLKKSGKRWKQKHTDFFKVLMKMMEKRGTEIIYVVGNHDDFLDSLAPFKFSNIIDRKGLFTEDETRKTLFRDTWRYFRYGYDPYALACHARGYGIYFFIVVE